MADCAAHRRLDRLQRHCVPAAAPTGAGGAEGRAGWGGWRLALQLDDARHPSVGSTAALGAAVARGAELRIGSHFTLKEHVEPSIADEDDELVVETAEFGVVYAVAPEGGGEPWVAGLMTNRQPLSGAGFGPRSSMSYFLYNQDGQQACARLFLDGPPPIGAPGTLHRGSCALLCPC